MVQPAGESIQAPGRIPVNSSALCGTSAPSGIGTPSPLAAAAAVLVARSSVNQDGVGVDNVVTVAPANGPVSSVVVAPAAPADTSTVATATRVNTVRLSFIGCSKGWWAAARRTGMIGRRLIPTIYSRSSAMSVTPWSNQI